MTPRLEISTRYTAICWLLALGLSLLLILPAHVHIHHVADGNSEFASSSHQHKIELGVDHHAGDHVLDVSKEALSRKTGPKSSPIWVAILPLLVLHIDVRKTLFHSIDFSPYFNPRYPWRSPPLRAPPH